MARVLFITQHFPPEIGAAQTRLMALAQQLVRRGHETAVITALPNHPRGELFPSYRGKWLEREEIDGVKVVRTWVLARGTGLRSRLLTYITFAATALIGRFYTRRPDVVLTEMPPVFAGLSGWLIARLSGAPLVLYAADLWAESAGALGVVQSRRVVAAADRLERFVLARADAVSVPTEGVRSALVRRGIRPERVILMPNGVDPDLFKPSPPDRGWSARIGKDSRPVFAYVGNHGYVHGLDVLIEAAGIAGDSVRVLLVGEGSEKARLLNRVQQSGLRNVVFVEAQPLQEVPRILSLCCAAIASVRREPILRVVRSAKIFPAMACAKPVIYSGDDEGAEIIRRAACGLVVPAGDAHALADAMLRLAGDPHLATEMGARGRQLVEAEFTWSALVDHWLADLADLLPARVGLR